jgi:hypothetical protein
MVLLLHAIREALDDSGNRQAHCMISYLPWLVRLALRITKVTSSRNGLGCGFLESYSK